MTRSYEKKIARNESVQEVLSSSFIRDNQKYFMFKLPAGLTQFTILILFVVGALVIYLAFRFLRKNNAIFGKKSGDDKKSGPRQTRTVNDIPIKKFTASCDFGGQPHPITFYIGKPNPLSHPLQFQSSWISKSRGGSVPAGIMDSFAKIAKIAEEKHVPFTELCEYVINELNAGNSLKKDAKEATKLSAEKLKSDQDKTKENKA